MIYRRLKSQCDITHELIMNEIKPQSQSEPLKPQITVISNDSKSNLYIWYVRIYTFFPGVCACVTGAVAGEVISAHF